jgi:hypothetical protein
MRPSPVVGGFSTNFSSTLINELLVSYTRLSFRTYLSNEAAMSRSALGYTGPDLYSTGSDILPNV